MPRPINPDVQCDFKLHAEEIWVQRRRRNGEPFMLRLIVGERCAKLAIVSKMRDGKMRHRCPEHLGADWQD
jgi:hypothetical protein